MNFDRCERGLWRDHIDGAQRLAIRWSSFGWGIQPDRQAFFVAASPEILPYLTEIRARLLPICPISIVRREPSEQA
jgi:hypothetical protein